MFVRRVYGTKGSLDICRDRSGRGLRLQLQEEGPGREVDGGAQLAMVPDFSLDETTATLFGGERLSAYEMSFEDIDANLLAVEHAEFVDAILHGRRPEVAGEDGLRSLAVVFGMLESDLEGKFLSVDDVVEGKHRRYQDGIGRSREIGR
jgi:predicted dehydrogenase